MEKKHIPLHLLQCNEGQMEGLPTNPRYITDVKLKSLEKSLEQTPEMLELRELIVMPYGEQYIVIGGNMRLRAAQALGMRSLPCKVLPADTPVEKLKEYAIKDNGDFGAYDWDILANEWDDLPLIDWGVQMPHIGEQEERATEQTTEVREDNYNEEQEAIVCRCKRGDVWQLGNHRVMCGDSTNPEDVEKLRGGGIG